MKRIYKHPFTGKIKEVKVGYSVTTLFFGFFPALFRGDFKYAGLSFLISFVVGLFIELMGFGFLSQSITLVGWAIWANYYNEKYEEELIERGFQQLN